MPQPGWLSGRPGDWRVLLHVQPGASRTALLGEHDGRLKLALNSPPVDGRANEALLRWLALRLGVPRRALRIARGATARRKQLVISAMIDVAAFASLIPPA